MQLIRRWIDGPWVPPQAGRAPYLWIASLAFFGWKYLYVDAHALEFILLALTMIVFVPIYFGSFWHSGRAALPFIGAALALGVAWAPFNFGASTFFIFACAMCSRIGQPRIAYCCLAAILVSATGMALAMQLPLSFLIPTLATGTPVGIASIMDAQVQRSRKQLLLKQEEVEHLARIAERERISRDMHDLLGHSLSLITLKAELAGRLLERDPAACRREIKDIEASARHALAEVRSAVSGYRETGFAHELERARGALSAAGVTLHADASMAAMPAMPATAENVLALALREAVTNILRHAGATRCDVSLALQDGLIVFRISDNGKAGGAGAVVQGNGLRGMQERVAQLGGWLGMRVEQGMSLELRLPMEAAAPGGIK
ncbi:histidine kinase [Massilia sp. Root418]|jgi:two-component system sensor histidine kinase DesK|uniref:sensor histidine kinase n=1 Tax=Massilia sp. Root418 TaxID=1736532 RepID=UPI0006F2264D|nr:sensor histidine kinase [Massilia sp. Root418]KQW96432.1 histidine kinase [Massilia sp. Root418]